MTRHRKALAPEVQELARQLDQVVAAARVTRCPKCQARDAAGCRKVRTDCPAIESGLAHLWDALRQSDVALFKMDLT